MADVLMSVLALPTRICGMGSARLFTYSYMRDDGIHHAVSLLLR